jgi:hypothetical protein
VEVLKEQVAKLQTLLAMLAVIDEHKRTFPEAFVIDVTLQWNQKFSSNKQKAASAGSRKRKAVDSDKTENGPKQQRMFMYLFFS